MNQHQAIGSTAHGFLPSYLMGDVSFSQQVCYYLFMIMIILPMMSFILFSHIVYSTHRALTLTDEVKPLDQHTAVFDSSDTKA